MTKNGYIMTSFILYLISALALLALVRGQGHDDDPPNQIQFECDEENVKCYSLIRAYTTWDQALETCTALGRNLAIINNHCSQQLVAKFQLPPDAARGHAWISFRRESDSTWRYSSGEMFLERVRGDNNPGWLCVAMDSDYRRPNYQSYFWAKPCTATKAIRGICSFPSEPEDCLLHYYADGQCFRVTSITYWSRMDAQHHCEQIFKNGTLAHTHLSDPGLSRYLDFKEYWVGVERRAWRWYRDGKAYSFPYNAWFQSQGTGFAEECAHLELKLNGSWADKSCNQLSDFVVCETGPGPQITPFTDNDMFEGDYWPSEFYAEFYPGDVYIYRNFRGDVVSRSALTDSTNVVMEDFNFRTLGDSCWIFEVSDNLEYVLVGCERQRVYRDSFTARYSIYSRQQRQFLDFPNDDTLRNERLQYAAWGKGSTNLVFVVGNNVYYQDTPSSRPVQITADGAATLIINGIPDWMFEEDVLWTNKAIYSSTSGRRFCYARFDVSVIPLVKIPVYGGVNNMYPYDIEIAIPKAGYLRNNGELGETTKIALYVFKADSTSDDPVMIPPPSELANEDHYYTSVEWIDDVRVYVTWSNRAMNRSITTVCDTDTMECVKVHDLTEASGWIYIPAVKPVFLTTGDRYLTILPKTIDDGTQWRHLAIVNINSGDVSFLTDGPQEVTDLLGYDPQLQFVYYRTTAGEPTERYVYSVSLLTDEGSPECLSCSMGPDCLYSTATFSQSGVYYILNCMGPGVPSYHLRSTTGVTEILLEDNAFLKSKLVSKRIPTKEYHEITTADNRTIGIEVIIPPSYVPGRSFPLLHVAYGAPDSQQVTKVQSFGTYRTAYLMALASSRDVVVMTADGRGTYGRGDANRFALYQELGRREVEDHIQAVRYVKQMPYVSQDANAAVMGWSYGGLVSTRLLADPSDLFQCGLAISPVTSKRYYDRAYSERFLGFANESQEAYDGAQLMTLAPSLVGKKYFIAHGTKDDNVQYQHTAQLISQLTRNGVQFVQRTYVDENHDLSTFSTTLHLYESMTDFLLEDCWG